MSPAEPLLVAIIQAAKPEDRRKLVKDIISTAATALVADLGVKETMMFVYRVADNLIATESK